MTVECWIGIEKDRSSSLDVIATGVWEIAHRAQVRPSHALMNHDGTGVVVDRPGDALTHSLTD